MTTQNTSRSTSAREQLTTADLLLAEAELYRVQYMRDKSLSEGQQLELILKAYLTFSQAIALFESAGDFTDDQFKCKLAKIHITCSYAAGRYANMKRTSDQDLAGFKALRTSLYKKGVVLYGQTIGDMQSSESLKAVWSQILRLQNISALLVEAGSFGEAESFALDSVDLQKQFAKANDEGRLDHRVWLPSHIQMAKCAIGLHQSAEHILSIINAGLEAFSPVELRSASGLKSYGQLCALKGEVIEASSQSE